MDTTIVDSYKWQFDILGEMRNVLFENAEEILGFEKDSDDSEMLFDYFFNDGPRPLE